MSDTFGAVPVPLVAPSSTTPGDLVSDPFLTQFLAYLKAFLVTDGGATAAWSAIAPNQGPPIVGTFGYNPDEPTHTFREQDLPALFVWRDDSTNEQWTDDWQLETTTLKLLWIWPVTARTTQSARATYVNGLAKAIKIAIARGCTPSFVTPNDPDFRAPVRGSFWMLDAGVVRIDPKKHRPAILKVEMVPDAVNGRPVPPKIYRGLEMTIELQEQSTIDITREPPYDEFAGTDTTVIVNGGPSQVQSRMP